MLGLLAGCSGPSGNATNPPSGSNTASGGQDNNRPPAGGVELNVVTSYGGDDGNRKNYEAAVKFVRHMTSDQVLSTFVTTEVTALKNGASPAGLNELQQSAADANANVTDVIGAVQDTITSECKTDLFSNVQNVVIGSMSAEDAVSSAIALN